MKSAFFSYPLLRNITRISPDSEKKFLSLNSTLVLRNSNLVDGLIMVNSGLLGESTFGVELDLYFVFEFGSGGFLGDRWC